MQSDSWWYGKLNTAGRATQVTCWIHLRIYMEIDELIPKSLTVGTYTYTQLYVSLLHSFSSRFHQFFDNFSIVLEPFSVRFGSFSRRFAWF